MDKTAEGDLLSVVQMMAQSSIIFLMSTTKPSSCGEVKTSWTCSNVGTAAHGQIMMDKIR